MKPLSLSLITLLAFSALLSAQKITIPDALRAPSGQVLLAQLHGKGKQIYVCDTSAAWKLKAPEANLYNESGELVGHHFAGPTWESTDGSKVVGKMLATAPSPDPTSIPWLLLTMVSRSGAGIFSKVQTIQRLETKGGVAPTNGCTAANLKAETAVPYEAIYSFYGEPSH